MNGFVVETDAKSKKSFSENVQQRKLTPTLTFSNADEDVPAIIDRPLRRSLDEVSPKDKHSDINPDIKDIKLLASMQEQGKKKFA